MLRFFYRVAWGAGRLVAPLLSAGDGKFARSVRGRRGGAEALAAWASLHRDTRVPLAWFHAASVGEGRQAEAVLVRLRAARPDWQIAYTHSSASAEKLARSLPADVAGYVPMDTPADTERALAGLRPRLLIFAATDVWPELVHQARARGVKTALISATLAPTSSRRGGIAAALLRDTFASLDLVTAIGEDDAAALRDAGVRADRLAVTGDTRHDAAAARAAAIDRRAPHVASLGSGRPLLVAGSTWPADEAVLLDALRPLATRPALVIAPHEPSPARLADLERQVATTFPNLRIVRLSTIENAPAPGTRHPAPAFDVCLVDRVGVLAELYAAATMAYVGGGFHDKGLHSVIEPAALGVPVVFGPRWRSSRDAKLLIEAGGGVAADDATSLGQVLAGWLGDDAKRNRAGMAARAVVDSGIGAADRTLERLLALTGA